MEGLITFAIIIVLLLVWGILAIIAKFFRWIFGSSESSASTGNSHYPAFSSEQLDNGKSTSCNEALKYIAEKQADVGMYYDAIATAKQIDDSWLHSNAMTAIKIKQNKST